MECISKNSIGFDFRLFFVQHSCCSLQTAIRNKNLQVVQQVVYNLWVFIADSCLIQVTECRSNEV